MSNDPVDTQRVKRILGMIDAQPKSATEGDKMTFRGAALVETYNMLLGEVASIIPDDLKDEFSRLFKPLPEPSRRLNDLFGQAEILQRALAAFATLGGWLRNVVQE
ncbi:MAG: hypothetical protein LBJ08_08460 [Bifidobacteriaceae bacterium]|jgi:hypothetical protein|nr:hypothetical protein [Bifidobacteriaceae bacterium]